jgi:putative ABC transport system permease protein
MLRRLRSAAARLAGLPAREARDRELAEELATHLEMQVEENLRAGMSPAEARRRALVKLGGATQAREECRRRRGFPVLEDLWQDLRFGARTLRKSPGFTLVAVLTLALGVGANSAIFSVVNAVLLRPLPYKDPDRLVMVWEKGNPDEFPINSVSAANFIDWREQSRVFEGMSVLGRASFNLTGAGEPLRVDGRRVSANLFRLLGVEPQLGRAFLPEEDDPGAGRVVILSHGLWQRRFGADPSVVGRPVNMNGHSYTVVGVMSPQFQFPSRQDELWVPIAFAPKEAASRGNNSYEVLGRLKQGVTLGQAQAEMNAIASRLKRQYPDVVKSDATVVVSLHEQTVGDIKTALLVLLGAVGFVLLVACANVANLLLARAAVRRKEVALRVALGAGRMRLMRQFLTESVLLAALGGALGLLLALWGLSVLKAFVPESLAEVKNVALDARLLGFTAAVSLVTGLVFGLAPAAQASRLDLNEMLKEGGRDSSSGRGGDRLRGLLVVAEVAVSLVLLIGAGLLVNSFVRLRSLDPGFSPENLLTMSVMLPQQKYPDHARRVAFFSELTSRVEALPGVRAAAVTNWIPLTLQGDTFGVSVEGRPDPGPDKRPDVVTRVVSQDYFDAMGIRLLRGRKFDERTDRADSRPVAVVSETMARRLWPGEDPIGKRVQPGEPDPNGWIEVVGVAGDVRQFDLAAEPRLQMYLPYAQFEWFVPRQLVVKTDGEPAGLAAAVRKTVWELDRDQPVSDVRTMEEVLSGSVARQRFSTLLLGVFAALALLLAAVGIYGVMSYAVAQRTREIGIRIALGAQAGSVLRLMVGQGLKLAAAGVALGLVGALLLTRLMSSLLFGVSATDPATLVCISVVLVGVALLASYIPARRAAKVDPLVALRYQ